VSDLGEFFDVFAILEMELDLTQGSRVRGISGEEEAGQIGKAA
jgi:hypothetical protein